jgi:FtsH-binding integral membrane protein
MLAKLDKSAGRGERAVNAKTYLTISAVFAVLFGLAFLLAPTAAAPIYGVPPDPHTALNLQFFASALVGFGAMQWFARDYRDWEAVRGVLIASVIANALGLIVNLIGTFEGLLNGMAWTTTLIHVLFIIGAVYCLTTHAETSGAVAKPAR